MPGDRRRCGSRRAGRSRWRSSRTCITGRTRGRSGARLRTPPPTASWPPSSTPRSLVPCSPIPLFFIAHLQQSCSFYFLLKLIAAADFFRLRCVPRRSGDGEQPADSQRQLVLGQGDLSDERQGDPVGDGVREPRRHGVRVASRVVLPCRCAAGALPLR